MKCSVAGGMNGLAFSFALGSSGNGMFGNLKCSL